jgi:hypothetical protein
MISLCDEPQLGVVEADSTGTIAEFIRSHKEPMDFEAAEVFATELNAILVQLVHDPDNGFSTPAVCTLPKLRVRPLFLMFVWILEVNAWIDNLASGDRAKLERTQIIWA